MKALTLEDLIAARDAMESWHDAFKEGDPDAAVKVEKTVNAFNAVIARMEQDQTLYLGPSTKKDIN